jgi:hypothetical protein
VLGCEQRICHSCCQRRKQRRAEYGLSGRQLESEDDDALHVDPAARPGRTGLRGRFSRPTPALSLRAVVTTPVVDNAERVRSQIRAVLVANRMEPAGIRAMAASAEGQQENLAHLRARSIDILDAARAQLDGNTAWHPEVLEELARARAEVDATD